MILCVIYSQTGLGSKQPDSWRCPCSFRRVGPDDPWRSPPTQTIQWFYGGLEPSQPLVDTAAGVWVLWWGMAQSGPGRGKDTWGQGLTALESETEVWKHLRQEFQSRGYPKHLQVHVKTPSLNIYFSLSGKCSFSVPCVCFRVPVKQESSQVQQLNDSNFGHYWAGLIENIFSNSLLMPWITWPH